MAFEDRWIFGWKIGGRVALVALCAGFLGIHLWETLSKGERPSGWFVGITAFGVVANLIGMANIYYSSRSP